MSKQQATQRAPRLTVTAKLFSLFDQFDRDNLCVSLARDAAEAFGLNRTSAEIAFYRWRDARGIAA